DLLIEAEAESMEALHQLRKQLDRIPDIGKVTTHIVMGQWRH
ncbi:MAG: Lrp/AsnC ligand binding domain-containing protein, partial [Thiothrix sp.]|nr:Lrp/AsnC ligand binding domain-containing protein [Thiothrix sp.]